MFDKSVLCQSVNSSNAIPEEEFTDIDALPERMILLKKQRRRKGILLKGKLIQLMERKKS